MTATEEKIMLQAFLDISEMNIANGKTSTKVLNGVDGNTRKSKS